MLTVTSGNCSQAHEVGVLITVTTVSILILIIIMYDARYLRQMGTKYRNLSSSAKYDAFIINEIHLGVDLAGRIRTVERDNNYDQSMHRLITYSYHTFGLLRQNHMLTYLVCSRSEKYDKQVRPYDNHRQVNRRVHLLCTQSQHCSVCYSACTSFSVMGLLIAEHAMVHVGPGILTAACVTCIIFMFATICGMMFHR